MKNILITIIAFFISVSLYSQNGIDPAKVFIKDTSSVINLDNTEFVKSWNWGASGAALDSAMHINWYHHIDLNPDSTSYYGNSRLLYPLEHPSGREIIGGRKTSRLFQAHSLYLDPTISVDSTSAFKAKPFDNTGAVFGFLYKSKVRLLDSNQHDSSNYSSAIFNKDSLTTGQSHVVLKHIWKGDIIRYINYPGNANNDTLNATRMFLTINLKSLDPIPLNLRDSTILSIKVPLKYYNHNDKLIYNDTIKFHSFHIATPNINADTMHLYGSRGISDYRGIVRRTDTTRASLNQTEWRITGAMLDADGNGTADSNITISAFFKCDQRKDDISGLYLNNRPFRPDNWLTPDTMDYITNLDVEVKYHKPGNGISLGLRFLRFETPRAQEIFRGRWDNTILEAVNFTLARIDSNLTNPSLYRFYTDDELIPCQWATNRYLNMLLDTMAAVEAFIEESNLPVHYMYALEFKENWNGSNIRYANENAVPYIRKGIFKNIGKSNYPSPRVFNYQFGYAGNNDAFLLTDTLQSHYETFLTGHFTSIPITDTNLFEYEDPHPLCNYPFGVLFAVERFIYRGYYKNKAMLYDTKPWWANLWTLAERLVIADTINSFSNATRTGRIKTGEEIRLQAGLPVMLGAKGLVYWLKRGSPTIDNPDGLWLGMQPWNRNYGGLSGDALLQSDVIGGDFVNVDNDPNGLHNFYDSSAYRWDLMNITEDRIYLGLASTRTQIANLNKWIEHNNNLLLSLKLQAWKGKGFLSWYSQAPGLQDSIMKKYINISETKVRRLSDQNYEHGDSVFYDLVIHKMNGVSLDSVQYWAVQSRRTDPLIFLRDTLYWESPDTYENGFLYPEGMRFYSTAEMEHNCDSGGYVINTYPNSENTIDFFKPASYWRNLWWKRQGSREISIKSAVIDANKNIYYKIEEISDGTEYSDDLPFWKKEEINNRVKTVIRQGESFTSKYLPGSGKFFKVILIYDNTNIIIGELAHSNQTKMVAYPANQDTTYDFWKPSVDSDTLNFFKDSMMYYHIVYDRKNPVTNRSRVYYRRSAIPYNREINTKIINWGNELLISDTLVYTRADHLPSMDPRYDSINVIAGSEVSCRYPSIVVRYNEVAQKAFTYIVFSCTNISYPDTPRVFLVESAFPHDDTLQTQIPNFLKPIAYGYTGASSNADLEKFGGVSINASFSGNYYAWCDSIYGIGVGWKAPNNRGYITNKRFVKFGNPAVCTQPSLNTYSRMNINEENCALVYREFDHSFHQIIYTRLHNPSGQIDNYVQPQICGGGNGFNNNCTYSGNNKSVMLNPSFWYHSYNQAEYPVVYRPVDFARRPGFEFADSMMYVDAQWDRVYWQAKTDFYPSGSKSIFLKNIDISEPQNCWTLLPPLRLYSTDASLVHPSPGPGAPSSNTDGIFSQYALSDSSFILSFIRYPTSGSPDYNSDIHQINHNAWLSYIERWTLNSPFDDMIDMSGSLVSIGKGKYPHTAHSPVITKNQDWYFQNRIFQTTGETIKTSAWWFLKGQTDEKTIYPMLSISDSTKNAQMSEIYMVDNQKSIGLKAFDSPEKGQFTPLDTIYSNWFRVDEIKELGFYSIVGDTSLYRIELESSKGKIDIPVRKDYSKFLTSRKITLLNGKNNLYRIKLIKRDKKIKVWVDLLFDSKRDLADMSNVTRDLNKSASQDNSNHQIIDLGSGGLSADMDLRIFPNPANDFIYATGELLGSENQIIVYSLYNAAGLEVFKSEGISGQPIMIPTSDLTSGAYFLKAEQKFIDDFEIKHIISKSVIIQR